MTYLQEGIQSSLSQSVKQGLLPAGLGDLTNFCSTVVVSEQVESQLCNERGENRFTERKVLTLFGKLVKNPPVRGLHREMVIELKKERNKKSNHLTKISARSTNVFSTNSREICGDSAG